MDTKLNLDLLKEGFARGASKGWSGFLWMCKILIPISFLTTLLQWSGVLTKIEFLLQPMMNVLNLPPAAALPMISGMLTGVYGGIAAMVVLPFTREQMTLLAIFILIAHNMIQEGVIQAKSGIHPMKATLFRLIAATMTVMVVARFLGTGGAASIAPDTVALASEPFISAMSNWAAATLRLTMKIFGIIMTILIVLEVLKALGWIGHIVSFFTPFLMILGLSRKVGILWITAVVFGLAYGAAVILEEAKRGDLTTEDLEVLHLSIGVNHSMVEDPILFMSLGLSPFWLWVPRLITAIIAVQVLKIWRRCGTTRRAAV